MFKLLTSKQARRLACDDQAGALVPGFVTARDALLMDWVDSDNMPRRLWSVRMPGCTGHSPRLKRGRRVQLIRQVTDVPMIPLVDHVEEALRAASRVTHVPAYWIRWRRGWRKASAADAAEVLRRIPRYRYHASLGFATLAAACCLGLGPGKDRYLTGMARSLSAKALQWFYRYKHL